MQSYFKVPEDVKLNTAHFLRKFQKTRELEQIAYNNSSDIDSKLLLTFTKNAFQNRILF